MHTFFSLPFWLNNWPALLILVPTGFVTGFIGAAVVDNHFRPYQGRLRPKAPEANAARWSRP